MKFLIDENVGNSVVRHLKDKRHDVVVASKKGFTGVDDDVILEYAFNEKRIIITNDKDFGYLIYRQKLPSHGVILFRFIQELPSIKAKALDSILSLTPERIFNHLLGNETVSYLGHLERRKDLKTFDERDKTMYKTV